MNIQSKLFDDQWDVLDIGNTIFSSGTESSSAATSMPSKPGQALFHKANGDVMALLRCQNDHSSMPVPQSSDAMRFDQLDLDEDICLDFDDLIDASVSGIKKPSGVESNQSLSSLAWFFDSSSSSLEFMPPAAQSTPAPPSSMLYDLDLADMEPIPINPNRMVVVSKMDHTAHTLPKSAQLLTPLMTSSSKLDLASVPSSAPSLRPRQNKRSRDVAHPSDIPEISSSYNHTLRLVPSSDEHLKRHKRFKKDNKTSPHQAADKQTEAQPASQVRSHSDGMGANTMVDVLPSASSCVSLSSAPSDCSTCSAAPSVDATSTDINHIRQHQETQWETRFNELCAFKKQFGHCSVPYTHKLHPHLAQWTKRQRYQFKLKMEGRHCTLTDRRQQILDEVGFVWDSHHALWESRFQELCAFQEQHGHCLVPCKNSIHRGLAVWIKCQRRQYRLLQQNRPSNITQQRIDRLNGVGFCWSPRKA